MIDVYLYDDCPVLRNKLGIKDGALLDIVEVEFSCNAINELLITPIDGNYDFKHLCEFHGFIFGDVYDWAGVPRTVCMEKQEAVLGYMSIEYSHPNNIVGDATAILDNMKTVNWSELTLDAQADTFSQNLAALWKVHPFREGNTRTIVTFMCQYIEEQGLPLDRKLFENNAAYLRSALVAATAIFPDGDYRKPDYLINIVKDSIKRGLM